MDVPAARKPDSPVLPLESLTPPEIVIIPNYQFPWEVLGAENFVVDAPAEPTVVPIELVEAKPVATGPVPVEVAVEPDTDVTVLTFDDHFAAALGWARYVLGGGVVAALCAGMYAVFSTAVASKVTIVAALILVAVILFFVVRGRRAFTAASKPAGRGRVAGVGERAATALGHPEWSTGREGSLDAVTGSGGVSGAGVSYDPTGVAPGRLDGTITGRLGSVVGAVAVPFSTPEVDPVTGSAAAWDGVTTPDAPPAGQGQPRNDGVGHFAADAVNGYQVGNYDPVTGGYGVAGDGNVNFGTASQGAVSYGTTGGAPARGFTGEVEGLSLGARLRGETHYFDAPSQGGLVTPGTGRLSVPQRATAMARSTLFGASVDPAGGGNTGAPATVPALSADVLRSMQTGSRVRRSVYATDLTVGPVPQMYLTRAWVNELRSGRHTQLRGVLRDSGLPRGGGLCRDGLCARGLLYNTADPDGWFWRNESQGSGWDHSLRDELNTLYSPTVWEAEKMNDSQGASWLQIANHVERTARV